MKIKHQKNIKTRKPKEMTMIDVEVEVRETLTEMEHKKESHNDMIKKLIRHYQSCPHKG